MALITANLTRHVLLPCSKLFSLMYRAKYQPSLPAFTVDLFFYAKLLHDRIEPWILYFAMPVIGMAFSASRRDSENGPRAAAAAAVRSRGKQFLSNFSLFQLACMLAPAQFSSTLSPSPSSSFSRKVGRQFFPLSLLFPFSSLSSSSSSSSFLYAWFRHVRTYRYIYMSDREESQS